MISTITTSTVAMISSMTIFGTLGLIGMVVLVVLCIQQEIFSACKNPLHRRFNRALKIALLPLLIAFLLQVIIHVTTALAR